MPLFPVQQVISVGSLCCDVTFVVCRLSMKAAAGVDVEQLVASKAEEAAAETMTEPPPTVTEKDPFEGMNPGCTKVARSLPELIPVYVEAVCANTEPDDEKPHSAAHQVDPVATAAPLVSPAATPVTEDAVKEETELEPEKGSELQPEPESQIQPEPAHKIQAEPEPVPEISPEPEPVPEVSPEPELELQPEPEPEPSRDPR